MAFYFSSDTKALYDTNVFPVASLPENKVEITEAVYSELLTKQNQGYVILADGSGNPYTVNQIEAAATDIKHAERVATTLALGHVKVGDTMTVANDGTLDVKSEFERLTIIDKIVNEDGTDIPISKTVTINDSSSWVTLGKLNITPSNKECILDFTFMLESYESFDSQNVKTEYNLIFGVFVGNTEVFRYSLMPSTDDYNSSPSFRCVFTANINNTIYIKVKRSYSNEPHSANFYFPKVKGLIM